MKSAIRKDDTKLSHYYGDRDLVEVSPTPTRTDVKTPGYSNLSAIQEKGKNGKVYPTSNTNSFTPAQITNLNTSKYNFKGVHG